MADGAAAPGAARAFAYHRSVAPMVWVMIALSAAELVVGHLIVALLVGRWAAVALSLATAGMIGCLVAMAASMPRRPVLLDGERLVMRVGTLKRVEVPVDRIAGLRASWDAAWLGRRDVLNLALIAYPNVVVDLAAPLPGRRGIRAVAHRLDDPAAFAAAIAGLRAAG